MKAPLIMEENMKSRLTCLIIALVAAVPVSVQAQNAAAQATSQANAQLGPTARIDAAMQAAAQADIPLTLLESKVAEGKAKNVPLDRIATAVEIRLQSLIKASEIVQRAKLESTSESELAVSADALEAGVSQNALVQISRSAPAERRAVAIATLTALVQLGHASEQALARVSAVVRSNAGLANLHAETVSQLGAGVGGGLGVGAGASGSVRIK
jgi:hypothetical protein